MHSKIQLFFSTELIIIYRICCAVNAALQKSQQDC